MPAQLIDAVSTYFEDTGMTIAQWRLLAEESPTQVKLNLVSADELEREVYMAVGHRFGSARHAVKEEIRSRLSEVKVEVDEQEVHRNGISS